MIYLTDHITFGDSLIITVFSMSVVFIVLYLISCLIRVLKVAAVGKENKGENKAEKITPKAMERNRIEEENINEEDDEELVAVIAAAVALSLGVDLPQIKIRKIKRVSQKTPIWAEAGRMEQIKGL